MIAHCMDQALRISRLPLDQWKAEIERLPDACSQPDCTLKSCRQRITDYMRVQYQCAKRLSEQRDSNPF